MHTKHNLGSHWLIKIRWAAVLGQLATLFCATLLLGLQISVRYGVAITCLLALSNIFFSISSGKLWLEQRGSQGLVLLFDVILLTALLYFYGGHTNPFSMFYLVHVVIAALLLDARWTWGISIFCSLCYAFLFGWYQPIAELSMGHMHSGEAEFSLHLQGMLVGFILIAFLISGFLQKMRAEIDWREQELALRKSNEEKLAAVTTLSASVAHELGTPLGAMMLIVDDMKSEMPKGTTLERDTAQLRDQLDRCASALQRLGQNSGELFGEMPQDFSIAEVIESIPAFVIAPDSKSINLELEQGDARVVMPKEGFRHVVMALIKNALEASKEGDPVIVRVGLLSDKISLTVEDSGKGMSAEELGRIGEPFFTTKDSVRGMGLGLFITKLFVERLGGVLTIDSVLGLGTKVNLTFPRTVTWEMAA